MKTAPGRWWDWTAVLCFMAALITVSYRLNDTKWTEDLNLVTTLTILGSVIGLALGMSRFSRLVVIILGIGYTIVLVPWQMTKVIPGDVLYWEKLTSVGGRLWSSLSLFLSNQPLADTILFLANMALLFWLVAIIGGYNLTRYGKPWLSIIIAGIAIIVIDIYHPAVGVRGSAMGAYAILTLVLVTRMHFLRRKREWDNEEITVDSDTGFSWGRGALVTGLVLVILAWNFNTMVQAMTPDSPERQRAITLWTDLRNRLENAVKPLRGTTTVPREYYGDQFSLGSGSQLSDREIFTVEANIRGRGGVPYYWRIRSYDRYIDGQWKSTLTETEPLSTAYKRIEYLDPFANRVTTNFRFHPERNLSMLYAPTMPIAISRSVSLISDTVDGEIVDVTSVVVDPMIRSGEVYEVVSTVASPTVAQLRGAGVDYPDWTEKYLQLPDDLPTSITDLADQITLGIENPYDQAAAITDWLRANIEYSQVLPGVPPGKDPIEWMLFTQKQAFCNYYATAEVLMLRHLGIPARWTAGYAQGEYDPETRIYQVRERDAHAWPEVFFPGYGWVEFEPTASQSGIRRPSGMVSDPSGSDPQNPPAVMDGGLNRDQSVEDDPFEQRFGDRSELTPSFWRTLRTVALIGAIAFIPLFALLMFRMGKKNRRYMLPVVIEKTLRKRGWRVPGWVGGWSSFVELSPMEKSFIQVEWMLNFLRVQRPESTTPSEQIRLLESIIPEGQEQAAVLLDEYQKEVYSSTAGDNETAGAAVQELWKIVMKHQARSFGEWVTTGKKPALPSRASRSE